MSMNNKSVNPRSQLVLSLFPGVDLLGKAFAANSFCVVRGPDPIFGDDIREFTGVPGRFDGVIAGSPCQGFSAANRFRNDSDHPSVQYSNEMLVEFVRVVSEVKPKWWLLENVPGVPDVTVPAFKTQRLPLTDVECGGVQIRTRHIQWGHMDGFVLRPERVTGRRKSGPVPKTATSKMSKHWNFSDQCRRQGFDPNRLDLSGWSKTAKIRAVGNGVARSVGNVLAEAVVSASAAKETDCSCGCGRSLTGKQRAATASCRKRIQRSRDVGCK